jgi:hypothetical protein
VLSGIQLKHAVRLPPGDGGGAREVFIAYGYVSHLPTDSPQASKNSGHSGHSATYPSRHSWATKQNRVDTNVDPRNYDQARRHAQHLVCRELMERTIQQKLARSGGSEPSVYLVDRARQPYSLTAKESPFGTDVDIDPVAQSLWDPHHLLLLGLLHHTISLVVDDMDADRCALAMCRRINGAFPPYAISCKKTRRTRMCVCVCGSGNEDS